MKQERENLREYRTWGLPLLMLMGLLFVASVLVNGILRFFF